MPVADHTALVKTLNHFSFRVLWAREQVDPGFKSISAVLSDGIVFVTSLQGGGSSLSSWEHKTSSLGVQSSDL